ncbi:MAG TPA: alpha-amylase family glycosyl hydrolase [Burkholderiales bacterium]|nr:alpha-amylase family glycosyl hydrolase [Burkholderiales bacterium]
MTEQVGGSEPSGGAIHNAESHRATSSNSWWKRGIVYQIYPLSFQDSDGDGRGDLEGIKQRLDYLVWLGVDAIWISPIYPSPMADFGYDVSDYCNIAPQFGTLEQFDTLVRAAHERGLKVILDFVPNHTSDQHPWFIESKSSRDNPKRDWYIWRDPAPGGGPPNNWISNFGGSAWQFDPHTGQYYHHAFLKEQPDLNWRNRRVRDAMYDVLRFWMERGVDGFRIDVLWHLMKDAQFRDNPPNPGYQPGDAAIRSLLQVYSCDQPEIFDIIVELRSVLDAYPDRVLIGEIYLPVERLVQYYGGGRGVHMPFNFQLIEAPWHARQIDQMIEEYDRLVPEGEWPNWVLGNHDKPRIASRVGAQQARVAAMLLLTLRGTPTMYYGDELGMENVTIPPDRVQDPWEKNEPGLGLGRDPQRTPMQWDSSPNAGFTTGIPWLPLAPDHTSRNVDCLARDPASILSLYRRLIQLRRARPALIEGRYRHVESHADLLTYEREASGERLLIALNFAHVPDQLALHEWRGRVLLSTYFDREGERVAGELALRADEGIIVELT